MLCGRRLRGDRSVKRQYGPTCWKKRGAQAPSTITELAKGLAKAEEKPSLAEWSEDVSCAIRQRGQRLERHVWASDYGRSDEVTIDETHPKWARR